VLSAVVSLSGLDHIVTSRNKHCLFCKWCLISSCEMVRVGRTPRDCIQRMYNSHNGIYTPYLVYYQS